MSSSRRLGRSPVKVHPGQDSKIKRTGINRNGIKEAEKHPISSAVRRIAGATPTNRNSPQTHINNGENDLSRHSKEVQKGFPQTGVQKSKTLKNHSPPSPDCVATLDSEDNGGNTCDVNNNSSKNDKTNEPSPKIKSTISGGTTAHKPIPIIKKQIPKLKVVLDMDECMIHSIFNEGIQPGRMAFARPNAPPPSPPPSCSTTVSPVESFHLIMLDKAACTVNKRPRIDWFLEQVTARFDCYVMTAGTRDYAEPLLDRLDPKSLLKGRFYRDSCVFHDGHYFKDLNLVDEDPKRVVLVDNNPASFVLCPTNGIPVTSFYDDPYDCALEQALEVLIGLDKEPDVRKPLRRMYNLETKLAPMVRHFQRRM